MYLYTPGGFEVRLNGPQACVESPTQDHPVGSKASLGGLVGRDGAPALSLVGRGGPSPLSDPRRATGGRPCEPDTLRVQRVGHGEVSGREEAGNGMQSFQLRLTVRRTR